MANENNLYLVFDSESELLTTDMNALLASDGNPVSKFYVLVIANDGTVYPYSYVRSATEGGLAATGVGMWFPQAGRAPEPAPSYPEFVNYAMEETTGVFLDSIGTSRGAVGNDGVAASTAQASSGTQSVYIDSSSGSNTKNKYLQILNEGKFNTVGTKNWIFRVKVFPVQIFNNSVSPNLMTNRTNNNPATFFRIYYFNGNLEVQEKPSSGNIVRHKIPFTWNMNAWNELEFRFIDNTVSIYRGDEKIGDTKPWTFPFHVSNRDWYVGNDDNLNGRFECYFDDWIIEVEP